MVATAEVQGLASLSPERLAALARLEQEAGRYEAGELERVAAPPPTVETAAIRKRALEYVESLASPGAPRDASRPIAQDAGGAVQELLRQKANLELQIQSERDRLRKLESDLNAAREENRQSVETLTLQQRKIKELTDERSRLLAETSDLDGRLRLQVNEIEQLKLQIEKLKGSRQALGDQAVGHSEQITALKAENESLRGELELVRKQRDADVAAARSQTAAAQGATADAAYRQLWAKLAEDAPEVFLATHVPTDKTFERLCEAMVELVRAASVIEFHVHQLLRDLRQVGQQNDPINQFYINFTRHPGMVELLRDFLATGRQKGNFVNVLRAKLCWARAFGTGPYKAIVRAPALLGDELNYKNWQFKVGFGGEDAALGKHFKEVAQRAVPDKLGTVLRKQAAELAHEDYNELMKRK